MPVTTQMYNRNIVLDSRGILLAIVPIYNSIMNPLTVLTPINIARATIANNSKRSNQGQAE
jgi:hypothetical protein